MAEKLERKVMEIYGENAATRDIIAYGSDIAGNIVETKDPDVIQTEAYKTGVRSAVVGNNSTTLQNRQALDFLFSRQLKYLYQHGIAEWGADETYFVNSLAVGSNGNLYVSLTDNNKGNDPTTDTTNWQAFPTPAQLAQKVAKAGDTMTGPLKMSGKNEIKFGPDDNYFIKMISDGTFEIYGKNGKGLFLQSSEDHTPCYWDGTNAYRLLTKADLENLQTQINSLNTEVTGMLGRMNFNARVDFSLNHGQSYTVPSKGYLWINSVGGTSNGGNAYINGGLIAGGRNNDSSGSAYVRAFVPVSAEDVLNAVSTDSKSTVFVSGFFVPQI